MADLVRIFCFNNSYHATPFVYYYAKIQVYSKTVNAVSKKWSIWGEKLRRTYVSALVRPEARLVDSAPPPYFYDWDLVILRIKC